MKGFPGLTSEAEVPGVSRYSDKSPVLPGQARCVQGQSSPAAPEASCRGACPRHGSLLPRGRWAQRPRHCPPAAVRGRESCASLSQGLSRQVDGKGVARRSPSPGPGPAPTQGGPFLRLHPAVCPCPRQSLCGHAASLRCNPRLRLASLTGRPGCSPRGWRCSRDTGRVQPP